MFRKGIIVTPFDPALNLLCLIKDTNSAYYYPSTSHKMESKEEKHVITRKSNNIKDDVFLNVSQN